MKFDLKNKTLLSFKKTFRSPCLSSHLGELIYFLISKHSHSHYHQYEYHRQLSQSTPILLPFRSSPGICWLLDGWSAESKSDLLLLVEETLLQETDPASAVSRFWTRFLLKHNLSGNLSTEKTYATITNSKYIHFQNLIAPSSRQSFWPSKALHTFSSKASFACPSHTKKLLCIHLGSDPKFQAKYIGFFLKVAQTTHFLWFFGVLNVEISPHLCRNCQRVWEVKSFPEFSIEVFFEMMGTASAKSKFREDKGFHHVVLTYSVFTHFSPLWLALYWQMSWRRSPFSC